MSIFDASLLLDFYSIKFGIVPKGPSSFISSHLFFARKEETRPVVVNFDGPFLFGKSPWVNVQVPVPINPGILRSE